MTQPSMVSNTILTQLGGGRFIGMTGAKDVVFEDRAIAMRLPRNMTKNGIAKVRIVLDPDDTYRIETYKFCTRLPERFAPLSTRVGVYASQLRDSFTDITGLYTSIR